MSELIISELKAKFDNHSVLSEAIKSISEDKELISLMVSYILTIDEIKSKSKV